MNQGASVGTRTGGTPAFPAIELKGDVSITLSSSTQPGAQAQFNYPITGPYQLLLRGNSLGGCVANFNVPNTFNKINAYGAAYIDSGLTIKGNAAGSLGTGDITIAKHRTGTGSYAILEINAANAMADTATLSISGTTGTMLRMNANDTIAAFIFNGVAQPAGTYGSTTSSATYKFSWITGSGLLTVGAPTVGYWDVNGATAGAGGISPSGTWDAAGTNWNTNTAGTGSVAAWTPGNTAIFSAGSDATGAYVVDVVGSHDISGILVRNGAVSLTQGSGGNLRLTGNGTLSVGSGSSGIAAPIGQDATARSLTISNVGSLTLSGDLSHTGGTTLVGGTLVLAGNNSAASGATTVNAGTLFVNAANAIPGTTRNLTINASGILGFGASFGSGNIQTALNSRIVTSSAGTIVANDYASTPFDFNAAGLTAAYFGSLGDLTYTGTLTPQGTTYRLNGEGGMLTMANPNAITSGNSLTVRGLVTLAANNDYTGTTTVLTNGSLSLLGSTTTSGITLNTGSTLTIGNNNALGSGTLTLAGLSTLKAVGTVDISARPIAANADFNIAGSGTLTLGTATINANRTITNIASGTTTF
jgi:autotransporter-associated beta strand protein